MYSNTAFIPDESQRRVITLGHGRHLVLAPPGCGKTQILTERVVEAHSRGIDYADMLMLTFTNRAARVMAERIGEATACGDVSQLYVGNIHRYCSQFLFKEGILPADASVIDEEDSMSILANHFSEDENAVAENFRRRRYYAQTIHLANMMRQIRLGHPASVRLHSECIGQADRRALEWLCARNRRPFDRQAMLDIYDNAARVISFMDGRPIDNDFELYARPTLQKMEAAKMYADYKTDHNLFDFNDLLILTYESLKGDADGLYHRYKWIQVDEVQDLSPLQLAIIDELTAHDFHSVTYLGDGQQAIFSFMGAKLSTLEALRRNCGEGVFHLSHNHRSPSYLLEVFNTYAATVLSVPRELLPEAAKAASPCGGELRIISAEWPEMLPKAVARQVGTWLKNNPGDTTAVIVQSNREADMLSARFAQESINHFKVSGRDVFDSPQMKLIEAHLDTALHDTSLISWTRLLTGMGIFRSAAEAREWVINGFRVAITPSDLLNGDGKSYIESFIEATEGDIVVFDTETTGLDLYADDIIQIAAVKLRHGEKAEQPDFCVYIDTQRHIPEMLGDIVNPIIEERRHHHIYKPAEALRLFIDYAEGCTLVGHNALFDYAMLHENLKRYAPDVDLAASCPALFDTLRLSRLLFPRFKQYKLKYLISELGLEGENSHLADADVDATCSLIVCCIDKARSMIEAARTFIESSATVRVAQLLREVYAPHHHRLAHSLLCCGSDGHAAMTAEMLRFYSAMTERGFIGQLARIQNVVDFFETEVIKADSEPLLLQQLWNHLREMPSYKESDLCSSAAIQERVFITTIHKAKGLEFDNVVIYDLRDERLPGSFYKTEAELDEKKRLVYVAMTRSRHRLAIAYPQKAKLHGDIVPQSLSRFVEPITRFFGQE